MDRSRQYRFKPSDAVRCGGTFTVEFLLPGSGREPGESRIDAPARRAVPATPLFRSAAHEFLVGRTRVRGQSQTRASVDAADGTGSDLSQATIVRSGAWTPGLSISIAWAGHRAAQSGVGDRYNVHSPARRFCILGGHHGLVQSIRVGLGNIGDIGSQLLHLGVGLGVEAGLSGNLQLRSRITIHERGVYRPAQGSRYSDQHGRTGACDGQHLRRTLMANGEIRGSLLKGLSGRARHDWESPRLLCILQQRTPTSVAGQSHTRGSLFFAGAKGLWKMTRCGNPQRPRIPTAACKTPLGFAHFPQARRLRSLTTEHFFKGSDPP